MFYKNLYDVYNVYYCIFIYFVPICNKRRSLGWPVAPSVTEGEPSSRLPSVGTCVLGDPLETSFRLL